MTIGISQLVLGDATLEETLDVCRAARYEAVELVFKGGKDLDVDLGNSELRAIKGRCESSGVRVTSVIALTQDRGSLLSLNEQDRRRYGESVVRALEIADELDAGAVLLPIQASSNPRALTTRCGAMCAIVWRSLLARQRSGRWPSVWRMSGTNLF
jgi:sugar phosphate isomerase/epimerase